MRRLGFEKHSHVAEQLRSRYGVDGARPKLSVRIDSHTHSESRVGLIAVAGTEVKAQA